MGGKVSHFQKSVPARLVCTIVLLLSSFSISAQSTEPQVKPVVLIAVLPLQGSPQEGVRKVLSSAIRFQLERAGTQTLLFATTDEQALVSDLLGDSPREAAMLARSLLEFFSGLNHEFLVLAGYTKEREEIQVSFIFADLQRGEIVASVSRRAPIDFALDEAMIDAIGRLLPPAEGRIEAAARMKEAEAAKAAEAVAERAALRDAGGEEEADLPVQTAMAEDTMGGVSVRAVPVPETAPNEQVQRFRPFEFSIGFAPFVPVGTADGVFSLSYAPFVYGSYRIQLNSGILGLGLCTGLNVFDSEEAGVASYFHYLVPAGIDARYASLDESRLGFFARSGIGVAFNVSDFSSLPQIARQGLSRVLAYGSAGVGSMVAISHNVGIAVDVMYQAFVYFYREESGGGIKTDWIMGFVPSIYLYTRI